jgi:hypothetical protein
MVLGCQANLALDLAALGRDQEALRLRDDALAGIRTRLGGGHPAARAIASGERLDFDIDLPPI